MTRFLSPNKNSRIGFGEGCVYLGIQCSIFNHQSHGPIKYLRVANLFEEDKGHKPSNDRESGRDGAGEEVRVLFQKLVVSEQAGEPLRRARECSSDDGSIPNPPS